MTIWGCANTSDTKSLDPDLTDHRIEPVSLHFGQNVMNEESLKEGKGCENEPTRASKSKEWPFRASAPWTANRNWVTPNREQ